MKKSFRALLFPHGIRHYKTRLNWNAARGRECRHCGVWINGGRTNEYGCCSKLRCQFADGAGIPHVVWAWSLRIRKAINLRLALMRLPVRFRGVFDDDKRWVSPTDLQWRPDYYRR